MWLAEREETQEDEEEKKLEQAAEAAAAGGQVAEKLAAALSALKKQAASSTHALLTHHALLLITLYYTCFCARRAGAASPLPPGCKRCARSRCVRLPVPACTHTHCRRLLLIHDKSWSLSLPASLATSAHNRRMCCTFFRRNLTVTSLRLGERLEIKQ